MARERRIPANGHWNIQYWFGEFRLKRAGIWIQKWKLEAKTHGKSMGRDHSQLMYTNISRTLGPVELCMLCRACTTFIRFYLEASVLLICSHEPYKRLVLNASAWLRWCLCDGFVPPVLCGLLIFATKCNFDELLKRRFRCYLLEYNVYACCACAGKLDTF